MSTFAHSKNNLLRNLVIEVIKEQDEQPENQTTQEEEENSNSLEDLDQDNPVTPPIQSAAVQFKSNKEDQNALLSAFSGFSRVFNSIKREGDRLVTFKGDDMQQAIYRIESSDPMLNKIKDHFMIFGDVCYDDLTYSRNSNYTFPVWCDPGAYCIREGLKDTINEWMDTYRKKISTLSFKMISKEKKVKLVKICLSHFCDVLREQVNSNWTEYASFNAFKDTGDGKYTSNSILKEEDINRIANKIALNNDFFKITNAIPVIRGEKPCFVDCFPVVCFPFIYSSFKAWRGDAISLYLVAEKVNKLGFDDFFKKYYKGKILHARINQKGDFRKNWVAFTYNAALDPYGEKNYEFWSGEVDQFVNGKTIKDRRIQDMAAKLVVSGWAMGAGWYAIKRTIIPALGRINMSLARSARHPAVGIALGAMLTVTYFLEWVGAEFFSEIDDIQRNLIEMAKILQKISIIYNSAFIELKSKQFKEKNNTLLATIEEEEINDLENNFKALTKDTLIILHKMITKSIQWGMESDQTDMQEKRAMAMEVSQVMLGIDDIIGSNQLIFLKGEGIPSEILEEDRKGVILNRKILLQLIAEMSGCEELKEKYRLMAPGLGRPAQAGMLQGFERQKNALKEQTQVEDSKNRLALKIIDKYKEDIKNLYNIDILAENATAQARSFSKLVSYAINDLKNISKESNKLKNNQVSRSDFANYASNFANWQRRTFALTQRGLTSKDRPKYSVQRADYIKGIMAFRSNKSVYIRRKGQMTGQQEWAWFLIGPGYDVKNTCFFLAPSVGQTSAKEAVKNISELEYRGNKVYPKEVGVFIQDIENMDSKIRSDYGNFDVFKSSKAFSAIKQLRSQVEQDSQALFIAGSEDTEGKLSLDSLTSDTEGSNTVSENSTRALNIILRSHVLLLSWIYEASTFDSAQNNEEINLRNALELESIRLHEMSPEDDETQEYVNLVNSIRIKGVKYLKMFDSEVNLVNSINLFGERGIYNHSELISYMQRLKNLTK